MNKFTLHLAGGALLATTALVSGTVAVHAQATITAHTVGGGNTPPATLTAAKLGAQTLTATSSAVTIGPQSIGIDTTANLFEKTVVVLNISGGAAFDTTAAQPSVSIWQQDASSNVTVASGTAAATVTIFSDRIRITDVTRLTWSFMTVSGLVYKNAQALATAGHSITVSGSISNSAETATLESIASKAVVTSLDVGAAQVTAGNTISISNTSTPQFVSLTQTNTATAPGSGGGSSAILSQVLFSFTTAVSTDLSATISLQNSVSTVEIKLTHGVLADSAISSITLQSTTTGGVIGTPITSADKLAVGSVTFSPAKTSLGLAAASSASAVFVTVNFNGTTAISAWGAGTTTVTPTAIAPLSTTIAAGTGTATALSRGGLTTRLNFIQPSTNSFASFIRISNTGGTAGAVTITVRSSSTGSTLGTYTSASIAAGGTIQVGAADIEQGAGITPVAGSPYDVTINGPITGYVQHIGFNNANGALSDLSAFRNGGTSGTVSNP